MGTNYIYPITIITATYNRSELLLRLFDSLKEQTVQDFQWLIIDDGSTDDTDAVIGSLQNHSFHIDYIKKPNGGKHTALNYSHRFIKGELCCIVDSDDWLIPSAIETILDSWVVYSKYENVKLMTFLKGKSETDEVVGGFPDEPTISNHIEFRINEKRDGDCCEVLMSDVLKEFPLPEFKGERFMGEGYLWTSAGYKYDTVYIKKIIYICDYLEGGLTKSGRQLRIKCPKGGMENSNVFLEIHEGRRVNRSTTIKEVWLFICYGKFAGLSYAEIVRKCNRPALARSNYLAGYMLYRYWKNKYLK